MASIETRNGKNGKTYRVRLSDGESPNRPRIGFGRITNGRQGREKKLSKVSGLLLKQQREDEDLKRDAEELRQDAKRYG